MKNDENDYIDQKVIFCRLKKTMMPIESSWNFFAISLRIVRPHIAEVSVWAVKVTVTVGDFWWNYPSVIATVAFLGQGIDCNCQLKKV